MKILMKITAILNIIYGVHYLALALIVLFAAGIATFASLVTFSLSVIGGTIGIILTLALCLGLTIVYGMGGIFTLKNDKKKALICMIIAVAISLLFLIIEIANPKIEVSFIDIMGLIIPLVNGFLVIQTTELN